MSIILRFLDLFFLALQILIFIRVLMSWIPMDRNNQFSSFIIQVTDPLLAPGRKIMNLSIFGGKGSILDFSPLIVLIILRLLQDYINTILYAIS